MGFELASTSYNYRVTAKTEFQTERQVFIKQQMHLIASRKASHTLMVKMPHCPYIWYTFIIMLMHEF